MSILKTLKLATATPTNSATSQFGFRDKVLRYLEDQKALADAEIAGTQFTATRMVTRTNEAGDKVRVEIPRHVRKGWFVDTDDKMYFQIRYGNRPIELAKGMNAVEIEGLHALPTLMTQIVKAIENGELDPQLTAARDARKANFKTKSQKSTT